MALPVHYTLTCAHFTLTHSGLTRTKKPLDFTLLRIANDFSKIYVCACTWVCAFLSCVLQSEVISWMCVCVCVCVCM